VSCSVGYAVVCLKFTILFSKALSGHHKFKIHVDRFRK
jgi:hypothetical protein